ncbi:MAG: GDP-mannose 4,6-dehydratase, partial [Verrucomicrobiales bacterium]
MKLIVTGGAGFIGSAMVLKLLEETTHEVVNLDKLTYAGNPESLRSVEGHDRYHFRQIDLCDRSALQAVFSEFTPEGVLHFAAESHVDRSIEGSREFIET